MTEVLRAADVRKAYGDTRALRGVSLSVDAGEVFGLIGPNGAGKTTLVRALTGTTRVEGEVRVFGQVPTEVDPARVGLLPQAFSPPGRLTARELLRYYAGLYDDPRDPEAVLADVGLADVGVADASLDDASLDDGGAADTWYENLSGGQQRRVCVGAALVNDPEVLFLDEPTTGIDPAGRRALWDLLEGLAAGGTTVFLTSHDMAEVERLADRVGLLADGRLVAEGSPDALVATHGGQRRLVVRLGEAAGPGPAGDAAGAGFGPGPAGDAAGGGLGQARTDLAAAGYETEVGDDGLVVLGVDPEDIGGVVDRLEAVGVAFESLTWTEPTLEDVYLELAGGEAETSNPEVPVQ